MPAGRELPTVIKNRNYPQPVKHPKPTALSRDDLVQYAREQDADTVVIAALLEIPDEEYDSPDAVVIELVVV